MKATYVLILTAVVMCPVVSNAQDQSRLEAERSTATIRIT